MIPGLFVSTWLRRAEVLAGMEEARTGEKAGARGKLGTAQQGLVHSAYLHKPTVRVAVGSRFAEVKYPHVGEPPPGGKRGRIVGRSMASCRNFRRFMACLLVGAVPVEFTLTYPPEFPRDPVRWKKDLRALLVAVERGFPQSSGIWVLERQSMRGAPHFHVLVFLEKSLPAVRSLAKANRREVNNILRPVRRWLGKTWHRIAGRGHEKHLKVGTGVRRIRSREGVASYLAGYLSKDSQTWKEEAVGRYWGAFNRAGLPQAEVETVDLSQDEVCVWARTLRKLRQSKRREQREAARKRGAKIRARVRHRAGSFWVATDVDALLGQLPRLVAAKAAWRADQRAAWEWEGWPNGLTTSGVGMRQHRRPCGLSTYALQAGAASERLTTSMLLASDASRVGRREHRYLDASGGTLPMARRACAAQTWEQAREVDRESRDDLVRQSVARWREKSGMREAWALYERENVNREGLGASSDTYSPRGVRGEGCKKS